MKELINTVVELYGEHEHPARATMSDEIELNPMKIRKLLITAEKYKKKSVLQRNETEGIWREKAVEKLTQEMSDDCLWAAITVLFMDKSVF